MIILILAPCIIYLFFKIKKYQADEYNNVSKTLPLYFRDIIYRQRMYGLLQAVNICRMNEIIMSCKADDYMELLPIFERDVADIFFLIHINNF